MGELYPSTTADYAYAAANDLQKRLEELEARLKKLEDQLDYFNWVQQLRGESK